MSFFDDTPRVGDDTIQPSQGAPAPRLGFLDGMDTAFRATTEATNQLALDYSFQGAEADQERKIRQAGGAPPMSLGRADVSFPYAAVARFYQNGGDADPDGTIAQALGERNAQIEQLQKQHPDLGLKTYDQLWSGVRQNAQDLTQRLADSPTTFGGSIGEFLGGAAGSMSPRTAPLNFATLALPAGELGLGGRMLAQGAGAGAADAAGQLIGGDERQKLLGTSDGSFSAGQVAEAAAGGAGGELLMSGLAHGAGAISKRLFPDSPAEVPARVEPQAPEIPQPPTAGVRWATDPANMRSPDGLPQISPFDNYELFREGLANYVSDTYGSSRLAEAMGQIDAAHVHSQLDAWDGPAPWEIAPPTDTAPLPDVTHVNFGQPLTRALADEGPDAAARRIDPETFRQVDTLSAQMEAGRQRLADLAQAREAAADAHVADLDKQIETAQQVADDATGKRRKPAQQALANLQQQRDEQRAAFIDATTRALPAARAEDPLATIGAPPAPREVPVAYMALRRGASANETDRIMGATGWEDVGLPYSLSEAARHVGTLLTKTQDPVLRATHTVMSAIFDKLKGASETPTYIVDREVADRIWPGNKAAGWYEPNGHYIVLATDNLRGVTGPTQLVLHEGLHAAYFWALERSPASREIVDFMLHEARTFALDNDIAGFKRHYGYTNAHEFISEAFSNAKFQRYLATVPAPRALTEALGGTMRSKVATLWDALLESLRKIIGVPEDHVSILDAAIRYGDALTALREGLEGREGHPAGPLSSPALRPEDTPSVRYKVPPDSVEMAAERANLMRIDEQQRDLAPLVSRAYAAANAEWKGGRYDPDTIRFLRDLENHPRRRWKDDAETVQPMMTDPRYQRELDQAGAAAPPIERPTLADKVPELTQRPDITGPIADKPVSTQVQAVLAANAKDLEPEIERFQSKVSKLLSEGAEDNKIRVGGVDLDLDKDTMTVPTADGEGSKTVSVRSFLQDLQDDHEALKAISSCRISS